MAENNVQSIVGFGDTEGGFTTADANNPLPARPPSEYLFSEYQASLANGEEINSGWMDMATVDKYQFEGTSSVAGMTQVIASSTGPSGTGATLTTSSTTAGTFQLFNVIARQRYMRFHWQNNTGGTVTNASLSIKASFGSSDKLSVLSLNTQPADFSQSILTQSVLYGVNEETETRNQVALSGNDNLLVALGDRISQTRGRSHQEVTAIAQSSSGALYTVPSSFTFYATSVEFTTINTNQNNAARIRLRDGGSSGDFKGGAVVNESLKDAGGTNQASDSFITYPDPLQFTTDVYLEIVQGTVTADVLIVGYLEPNS